MFMAQLAKCLYVAQLSTSFLGYFKLTISLESYQLHCSPGSHYLPFWEALRNY